MSDNKTPSFMQNPGWQKLQEELAAGKQAELTEARARLDEIKAALESVTEIKPGVSALGSPAPKDGLFVLRRRFHRNNESLRWLIERPVAAEERDEIVSLWSGLGGQPPLEEASFISLAEAEETERRRQEGQIETIRRLMQSPKISFGPQTELPETSSLGSPLTDEGRAFILNKWFFQENPGYKNYFYGMVFSEEEKTQLVWLFDEISPTSSFSSVKQLKEGLAAKVARHQLLHGTGSEPHNSIRERAGGSSRFQGHLDRHKSSPRKKEGETKPKAERKPRQEPEPDPDDSAGDAGESPSTEEAPAGPEAVHVEGNGGSSISELADPATVAALKAAAGSKRS
ncbi:MAG: hypothetical protein HYV55_00520, partial [Parcubacteria group bacterium]|nr:hypothetical protein [Parcubacteria group bacterium]